MLFSILNDGGPFLEAFFISEPRKKLMRLTNTIRSAFVRAAMADVPKHDYTAEIHKLIQDEAISRLPPKVKAVADCKTLRNFLKTETHYINGYQCSNVRVMHPEYSRSPRVNEKVEALLVEFAHQEKNITALTVKLTATAEAVSTRKALVDLLPEFEKYLPADEAKAVATLPAVANVLSEFIKAGWPKTAKAVATLAKPLLNCAAWCRSTTT